MTFLDDPYDIAPLLSEDGWTINARGDAWVVPAVQCYGLRITEIGTLVRLGYAPRSLGHTLARINHSPSTDAEISNMRLAPPPG